MKKNQLKFNMITNIFAFVINLGISFFFTPYLIRTVGREAYSFFPLANNFINYTNIITIALNSMASRFTTIKIHRNDEEGANVYYNSVLLGNTVIAIFFSLIGIIFILNITSILTIPVQLIDQVNKLFCYVLVGLIINIIGSVFGIATYTRNRLDIAAVRNIQSKIIYVGVLIVMFYFFTPSISYIGMASVFSAVYIFITNILLTKKLLPEIKINRKYYKFSAVKELVSSGIWNSINQLSIVLLTGLDLLIANMFLGPAYTGEYAIAQTIPNLIQSFIGMLAGVFIPKFMITYAKNKDNELKTDINQAIKFMGFLIVIPIGFLIVFGGDFFKLWVPTENYAKIHLLSTLVIIPMIVTGSINILFNVYTITNKLKVPALVLLVTGLLNSITVLILINTTKLGLFAIPITSMIIGLCRNLIFTPIYAAKCLNYKKNVFYKAILRGGLCTFVMFSICYTYRKFIPVNSWLMLILAGIITSAFAMIVNYIIVFNREERKKIFKMIINR